MFNQQLLKHNCTARRAACGVRKRASQEKTLHTHTRQPTAPQKTKLQKMKKVLGDDVMNFATSSTDVDELNAIFSQHHPSLQDGTSSTPVLICMRHIDHVYITPLV